MLLIGFANNAIPYDQEKLIIYSGVTQSHCPKYSLLYVPNIKYDIIV